MIITDGQNRLINEGQKSEIVEQVVNHPPNDLSNLMNADVGRRPAR